MTLGTQFFASVLAENNRQALHLISPDWFNDEERVVYDAIIDHVRLFGQLPNPHTLRQRGITLPRATEPSAYYVTHLPERAIHNHYRERLPELTSNMESRNVQNVVEILRGMVDFATLTGSTNTIRTMHDEAREIGRETLEARGRTTQLGITTGYAPLNEVMGGLLPSDLYAIVGRPGAGKSYTLFHMANEAWLAGASILIISMEMGIRQCARRIVGMNTGINPDAMRRGQISRFAEADFLGTLTGLEDETRPPMYFMSGDVGMTVADVDVLVQELRPDAFYFDAAYLAAPSRKRNRASRREYMIDTMEEIKGICVKRSVPGVMSTQLARAASKVAGDKGGLDLSMIAETDAIGQLVSGAVAVTPGAGAFKYSRRTHTVLKNREGVDIKYDTRFSFAPMNFRALPGTERQPDGTPWTRHTTADIGMDAAIAAAATVSTEQPDDEATAQGYVD